ncbi:MAG TPA: hypothetical protein GX012_00715 [Acholeplasma sp.]|nr:hypothetical protein [Acholeplasma sp.]
MKNKTVQSIILLILTLIALASTVFAWFAITDMNRVEPFALNVSDYSMELTLKINNEEANNKQQIDAILANAKPSDSFVFNLSIKFTGNVSNYETNILLYKIETSPLLEAFYIKDGKVSIYFGSEEQTITLTNEYLDGLIDLDENIILASISFNPGDTKSIEFTLVFDELSEVQSKILKINSIRIIGE